MGSWTTGGAAGSTHPKRPHQFVAEASDKLYLPNNKKPAQRVSDEYVNGDSNNSNNNNVYIGMFNSNVPPWGTTTTTFHPSPARFSDESEATKNYSGFDDRNFSSICSDKMNIIGYGLDDNPFGSVSSFVPPEGPRSSFGCGFKKVRVSEVLVSGPAFSTDPAAADNAITNDHNDDDIVSIGGDLYQNMSASTGHSYNQVEEIQTYEDSIPAPQSYKPTPRSIFYNKAPESTMTTGCAFNTRDGSFLSGSDHTGESTIISFGGSLDDDYDEMVAGLSPTLKNEATNVEALVNLANRDPSKKKKDGSKSTKNGPSNNFPPNVRCLLSTGILDGVPVKYIAWSKELPAVIKGSGYLCGCHLCKYSKVINAFEFERHAGCKTKHPNNHIYFENGKTIYGAVQELKTTPHNMLLDAIQNVAGSPINEESFRLWKVSFVAAASELKRIYGNQDVKQPF